MSIDLYKKGYNKKVKKSSMLPLRHSLSSKNYNLREKKHLKDFPDYVKGLNIRRLPIRSMTEDSLVKSRSRSAVGCNLENLSFFKVEKALFDAGIFYDKNIGKIDLEIEYTQEEIDNEVNNYIIKVHNEKEKLLKYLEHKNKLIYFTFSYLLFGSNEDDPYFMIEAHIIGGLFIKNDLDDVYIFLFGSYSEELKEYSLITQTMQQKIISTSIFGSLDKVYFVLFPDDLPYATEAAIQTDLPECQEYSVLIPILMAKSVNFSRLYGAPALRPPVLLHTLAREIEKVYIKYHYMSLSTYNDVRREVGLLGGRSSTISKQMPYGLRKSPRKNLYWVYNKDTGRKYSKRPISLEMAQRQRRAIYASENGYKLNRRTSKRSKKLRGGQECDINHLQPIYNDNQAEEAREILGSVKRSIEKLRNSKLPARYSESKEDLNRRIHCSKKKLETMLHTWDTVGQYY